MSETLSADEARLFHEGLRLFNAGEYFHAHEAWEDLWRLAAGARKRFYQGLIQCAVTLEHVRRGNPRGVLSVFRSARQKFEGLPATYHGVNVPELLAAMERFLAPIQALPVDTFAPGQVRGMKLPVNLAEAPKITLQA
jgi:predicted metal-dependent hydrolase